MNADWLKAEARRRWGEEWFVDSIHHADGTVQHRAHRTVKLLSDGVVIRGILTGDGSGGFECERYVVNTREYVAKVDEDAPNEP